MLCVHTQHCVPENVIARAAHLMSRDWGISQLISGVTCATPATPALSNIVSTTGISQLVSGVTCAAPAKPGLSNIVSTTGISQLVPGVTCVTPATPALSNIVSTKYTACLLSLSN